MDLRITITDGGVQARPGQPIVYTLNYTNTSSVTSTGVTITETVPANTTFDPANSPPGWTCTPDNQAGSTCTFAVGVLAPGASSTVTFAVIVDSALPPNVTQIVNVVSITDDGSHGIDPTPNNNASPETTTLNPTAINLLSFTAAVEDGAMVVRWTTGAEYNTWGYNLYRSATGSRADAVRVTGDLILAAGRGRGGASYTWSDSGAAEGVTYTYWLQEIELDGSDTMYGPTTGLWTAVADRNSIALPLINR